MNFKVADGYGQMLVTSVGKNTTWGEMMSHLNRDTNGANTVTVLQSRLNKLTSTIGKVRLGVALLLLVVLLIRYFTGILMTENETLEIPKEACRHREVVCIIIGAMSWLIKWVVKCIPVPENPLFSYLKLKKKVVGF
ncbi:hypothetical protein ACFE04_015151 [Oxalis oulophora]